MTRMDIDSLYIKMAAARLGADLCGIASIDRFQGAPEGFHPQDVFPGCKSTVVLASRFARSTLGAESKAPYTFVRNMMVNKMDVISFEMSNQMDAKGITAVPIPSAEPYEYWDETRRHGRGIIYSETFRQAGRPWSDRQKYTSDKRSVWQYDLVECGPDLGRVGVRSSCRLRSCIQDCRLCLDACPQGALDGVTIDQGLCRNTVRSSPGGGWYLGCNICRKICPNCLGLK